MNSLVTPNFKNYFSDFMKLVRLKIFRKSGTKLVIYVKL